MTRYTGIQIRDACAKAGFSTTPSMEVNGVKYSPADVMAAIGLAESGGDDQAVNSSSGAAGVFQILPSVWGGLIGEQGMHDLNTSALFSYNTISHRGTYFGAWVVYNEGTYKHFLPLSGATGGNVPASPVASTGQDVPGGAAQAGSIFGFVSPSSQEWKDAGIVAALVLAGMSLIGIGVWNLAKDPVETVVKAAV